MTQLTEDDIKRIVGASDDYWATSKVFITAIARAIEEALSAQQVPQTRDFAGWFIELKSAMSYRLWEQGGADPEPGYVALYTSAHPQSAASPQPPKE